MQVIAKYFRNGNNVVLKLLLYLYERDQENKLDITKTVIQHLYRDINIFPKDEMQRNDYDSKKTYINRIINELADEVGLIEKIKRCPIKNCINVGNCDRIWDITRNKRIPTKCKPSLEEFVSEEVFPSGKGNRMPYYCFRISKKGKYYIELFKKSNDFEFTTNAIKTHFYNIKAIIANLQDYCLNQINPISNKYNKFMANEDNIADPIISHLTKIGKELRILKEIYPDIFQLNDRGIWNFYIEFPSIIESEGWETVKYFIWKIMERDFIELKRSVSSLRIRMVKTKHLLII